MKIPTDIIAMGINSAKQFHQGVALAYPEILLISSQFENSYEAISSFDEKVMKLAQKNSKIKYGLFPLRHPPLFLYQLPPVPELLPGVDKFSPHYHRNL